MKSPGLVMIFAVVALILSAGVVSAGPGEKVREKIERKIENRFDGYEYLGSRQVDYAADHDTIEVTAKEGRFVGILIEVEEGNLEMHGIKITFGDGTTQSPDTRLTFKDDTRSRTIDLTGEARFIKKVEFKYESKGLKGKAKVNLFGKPGKGGTEIAGDKFPGYELIGKRDIPLDIDHDMIDVDKKDGTFTSIIIEVESSDLEMYNIKVTFGNDEKFSPDVRHEFKENSRSRQIDLPGEARYLKLVEFWYKSKRDFKGKSTVKLWGKSAKGGANNTLKDVKDRFSGWKHLGSRQVNFGGDKDTIEVGGDEGAFTSIKVEVENGELEFYDIKVTFGNGDTHSPDVRLHFKDDTRTRDIDLPGKARVIKKIEFKYKSTKGAEGKATVNLYGKK
ncbi:MAG: hypothetical protein IT462_17375 [Planctomycetes bacterium]|nr:hypothetical protein [Planctomycetota bacterium]